MKLGSRMAYSVTGKSIVVFEGLEIYARVEKPRNKLGADKLLDSGAAEG